jgi:galactokinase
VIEREYLARRLAELEPDCRSRQVEVVRAPGRVNLIGEYTDVNDGFVLPAAIDLEIRIGFVPTDDRLVVLHRLGEDGSVAADGRTKFDLDALPERSGGWADYAIGMARSLGEAGLRTRGIRGVIASTLPVGAGLSSSAAIEMAVAHALLDDAPDTMDPVDLARLGQRAENDFVGVQSGLMDQFASNTGRDGAALLLSHARMAAGAAAARRGQPRRLRHGFDAEAGGIRVQRSAGPMRPGRGRARH